MKAIFELFLTFFKIGLFTFGGGYAMISQIKENVVEKNTWLEEDELLQIIAIAEATPGPIAINMATYVGSEMGGILGSACATLGVVLPSFIVILIVAKCFERFKNSRTVSGVMTGLKPAVVGLIGSAVLSIAATVFIPAGFNVDIFKEPISSLL